MDKNEHTFNTGELIKVLLKIAQNTRELSEIEKQYDSEFGYPEEQESDILNYFEQNGYIGSHPVPIKSDSQSVVIMPYISTKGEGLTQKGEDRLKELINILKNEKKEKKVKAINEAASSTTKWILGIIATIIAGYIIWKLGWN